MGLWDEAKKYGDAAQRNENLDFNSLRDKIVNQNYSDKYDKAAANQEAKYRLGLEDRPSGPCFITTAVCDSFGKADDCYELTAFRNFRDSWLALQADGKNLIAEYYEVAPKIVEKINSLSNSAAVYKNIWTDYLSKCLKSIEAGDNLNCKKIYVEMVNTLKEKFLK